MCTKLKIYCKIDTRGKIIVFKKSTIIGVAVSPERGLEVAQIDYATGTVEKYGRKSIDYNIVKREIADLDLFKDSLQDLLEEMAIPKGAELVFSMPTVAFKVSDYPSRLETIQLESAIEEELYDNSYLKNYEPCFSYVAMESALQFQKVAYTALQKSIMIELALSVKEMGYKIRAIDTSATSVLNSLVYLDRVNTDPDTNWVLLTIDNACCRVMSMMGRKCLDTSEEKISIGEVLSDAENYATVIAAIEPLLRNLPAKYLCIVSKTNVISAEVISNKISYSAPIIYQEANCYQKEQFLNTSPLVDQEYAKSISLDVIGAAIYDSYSKASGWSFNLYNKTLGEVYLVDQPPMLGKIVLTNGLLLTVGIIVAAVIAALNIFALGWFAVQNSTMQSEIDEKQAKIAKINAFLEEHKALTTDSFDEGDEIRKGLGHNKDVYSYYTIVGTEIPQKLWLTHLKLGDGNTIEGQADNIESVYAFFRSIKDYNPSSDITLQKLGLASMSAKDLNDIDSESVLTTLNADFYEFRMSNEEMEEEEYEEEVDGKKVKKKRKKSKKTQDSNNGNLPELELIN